MGFPQVPVVWSDTVLYSGRGAAEPNAENHKQTLVSGEIWDQVAH